MRDLGPMPEPTIEPGEPEPGGVDAVDGGAYGTIPDLSPDENPAIDEVAPEPVVEQVKQGEDTSTVATRSDDGENDEPEKESPA